MSQAKAKEIEADGGFNRLGGGYDSQKQENYVHMMAHNPEMAGKKAKGKRKAKGKAAC